MKGKIGNIKVSLYLKPILFIYSIVPSNVFFYIIIQEKRNKKKVRVETERVPSVFG